MPPPCSDEQRSQSALQSCNRARSVLTPKVRPEKDEKLIRDKPLPKTSSGQLPGLGSGRRQAKSNRGLARGTTRPLHGGQ
jgi:hypothetical protein